MKIELDKVSKKFGTQWIFREVSASFESGVPSAIVGANGSGKTTLLKIISGIVSPNEGTVKYADGADIPVDEIYQYISYTSPYLELPEELTLHELLEFHTALKPLHQISIEDFIKTIDIPADKEIRNCSSGMKQRVKFALAYYSISKILLLDEPTANMDHHWRDWALALIQNQAQERVTIICSNEPVEYSFAEVRVRL